MSEPVEMADTVDTIYDKSELPKGWYCTIIHHGESACWVLGIRSPQGARRIAQSNKYPLTDEPDWIERNMKSELQTLITQAKNYVENAQRMGLKL